MPYSRLSRRIENKSKKQTYFFLGGILIIVVFLFKFGVPTLEILTNALSRNKGNNLSVAGKEFLEPPSLILPEATNSAILIVNGTAPDDSGEIEIYVNSNLENTMTLDQMGFNMKVSLKNGDNSIKARYVKGDKKSEFSEEYHVSFVKGEPKLEISNPHDGDHFTKADQQILVSGITDSENTVTVNGFVAIVDTSGNFTYNLNLSEGDNDIKIAATNPAGNTTTKTMKVNYSK